MITQTFRAPIGAGIRKLLVAPAAREGINLGWYRRVTVIVPNTALTCNWRDGLPDDTTYITPLAWLHRAQDDPNDLIICDELSQWSLRQIQATLASLETHVWLVNPRTQEPIIVYHMCGARHVAPGTYSCTMQSVTEQVDGSMLVQLGNITEVPK